MMALLRGSGRDLEIGLMLSKPHVGAAKSASQYQYPLYETEYNNLASILEDVILKITILIIIGNIYCVLAKHFIRYLLNSLMRQIISFSIYK